MFGTAIILLADFVGTVVDAQIISLSPFRFPFDVLVIRLLFLYLGVSLLVYIGYKRYARRALGRGDND